jgi:transmembrane sensor
MRSALEIEERAAHWLARRQEPEWTAADEAGLDAWLRESTAHEVAYLRLEYGWSKTDRLAALRRPLAAPQPDDVRLPSARRHRVLRRPLAWSAVAATLLLSVVLLVSYEDLFPRDVYTTGIGGHEVVPLPDGSRIELNTDTRVRTDFTPQARSVWLERGEAYFEVAHEPSRPFIVYAGGRRVTVLGTKFSVRVDSNANRVRLAVTEGRVQLEELRPRVPAPPMIAIGGDKVIAEGTSMRVESRSVKAVSIDLSWRQGLLTFDQTTLAAAAEEFNRYNRRRLVVEPTAAHIHIGGSFEAANVDAFARLLQQGFDLRVVESGDEIRISE